MDVGGKRLDVCDRFISIIFKVEQFSWNVVVGGLIITASIIISGICDAKMEKKQLEQEKKEEVENEENTSQQ